LIAVDSSTLVAFLAGDAGRDTDWLDQALALQQAILPPVVLTEILSAPALDRDAAALLRGLPVLDIGAGFWTRAAETRARILARRLRARLADTLIAQTCIDHCVPLLTRDRDFRHFSIHAGLDLL
jgi:hypothetical protein